MARKKKGIPVFNCFIWDFNKDEMGVHNVFEYIDEMYKYTKTHKIYAKLYPLPHTLDDAKKWCESVLMRQYWSRCEYEWIAHGWPRRKKDEKIDIYREAMMNIDVIAKMFMEHYGLY